MIRYENSQQPLAREKNTNKYIIICNIYLNFRYFNEFETECVLFSNCTITESNLSNELSSHLSLTVSKETEGSYKCVASEKNPDPEKSGMLDDEATNQFELKIYEDIPVIFDISVLNGEKIRKNSLGSVSKKNYISEIICQSSHITLFRKKRFMLDEKFQRNASKFAIFYILRKHQS